MSLRPSVNAFEYSELLAVLTGKRPDHRPAIEAAIRARLTEGPQVDRALEVVDRAMNNRVLKAEGRFEGEDEVVQVAVLALAQPTFRGEVSTLFWEAMMPEVALGAGPGNPGRLGPAIAEAPPMVHRSLRHLLLGRVTVGNENTSAWSYNAWLTDKDARSFVSWMDANPPFAEIYDYDTARPWLTEVVQAGHGLWWHFS